MESRAEIINQLLKRLQSEKSVLAFFEGGSVAFNYYDKYSDIDAYIICDKYEDTDHIINVVDEVIDQLGGASDVYTHSWTFASKLQQKFYRLKEFSPFLLIDLAVISQDAPEMFLAPEIHGEAKIYYDKTGITEGHQADKSTLDCNIEKEKIRLKARYKMFSIFFDKELLRKRYILAVDFYHYFIINTLINVLRIGLTPYHYNFRMAGLYREFPAEIIQKLEPLFFIKDKEQLGINAQQADSWILELMKNW